MRPIAGGDYVLIARHANPVLESMLPFVAWYRINPAHLARRLFPETMKIANRNESPLRRVCLMPELITSESVACPVERAGAASV